MKSPKSDHRILIIACLALMSLPPQLPGSALGTVFSYQGSLNEGANPASGSYDLKFTLFDTNTTGAPVAGPLTNAAVAISNGNFAVTLDFGTVFDGNARWLEVGVRTNSGGDFVTLAPRQPLLPTPYALYATSAGNAQTVVNGVYTSGSYGNPAWLASLAGDKITGNIGGNAAGFIGALAGDVNGTQSATVVSSVGGQSAANVASGVSAANAATNTNLGNTIVKRDASGNFSAGTLTLAGSLRLPITAADAGIIFQGSQTLIHSYGPAGSGNFFAGPGAGNLTLSGTLNTAVGSGALSNNLDGSWNTAVGSSALVLNQSGGANTASGGYALYANRSGSGNTANGYASLWVNTSGGYNTAVGWQSLLWNTTGQHNTALGAAAMHSNTNGNFHTAVGDNALWNNATGSGNTAIGYSALTALTNGTNNIAIGYRAGANMYGTIGTNPFTCNNNILIGHQGVPGESGIIRIGTNHLQTRAYIAGIWGSTASSGSAVYVDSYGALGTITSSGRFKESIRQIGNQSEVILALRPVSFRYKPDIDPQGIPQFGLVAEEVEKVAPELVVRDADGKPFSVRYEQINAMLLNEFLKEHRKVQDLEERLERLEHMLVARVGGVQ